MNFIGFWVVIIAIIIALSSALLGNILVLQKDSMLADALSHSVLPGIALAFFLTQSRTSVAMVIGAIVMALLTSCISNYLSETLRLERNSALGVVFTGFFALGIILITNGARAVDLDPNCVLFGAIELTPLHTISFGSMHLPKAALSNGIVLLVNFAFTAIFFKQFNIITFNPSFAKVSGIRVTCLKYVHILLVAITCVIAFESVGSIMIIAFLVIPPAIAWLFARSLKQMLVYSSLIAVCAVMISELLQGMFIDRGLPFVGIISAVLGVLFTTALLFSSHGVLFRIVRDVLANVKTIQEDMLKVLLKGKVTKEEMVHFARRGSKQHDKKFWSMRMSRLWSMLSLRLLERSQFIVIEEGMVCIDAKGMQKAKELSKKHRLWEEFLYAKGKFSSFQVHRSAEIFEHIQEQEITTELDKETEEEISIPGHKH